VAGIYSNCSTREIIIVISTLVYEIVSYDTLIIASQEIATNQLKCTFIDLKHDTLKGIGLAIYTVYSM